MLAGLGLENDLRCVQRCAGTQLAGRSEAAAPHRVEARVNARRPCGTHAARSTALKRHKGLAKRRQALFERHISCAAAAASADFGGDAGQQQSVDANDVENRGNATFPQAVFNVLNILLGIGLLSLPSALKQAGWAGLTIMVGMGIVMNYTAKVIGHCIVTVCKRENRDLNEVGYEDVALSAYGQAGRAVVAAIMYTELYGICALLFIVMGDNLHYLLAAQYGRDPSFYMMVAAAVMIPTVWLPDVKSLSYLGFAGVGGILAVVATVIYTYFTGSFAPGAATAAVEWSTMPVAFGCMAFCFAGHGIFPSIRASMQDVSKFGKAMDVSFFVTGVICATIASLGYFMYGTGVRDIITLSLPPGLLTTLCAGLILLSPVSKFALCMEPFAAPANAFAAKTFPGFPASPRRFIIRTGLAVSCLIVAKSIPGFSLLMALIGSFLTINVSLIFPALCHLKLHKGELSTAQRVWDWLVVFLGIICMISGTWVSVSNILAASA